MAALFMCLFVLTTLASADYDYNYGDIFPRSSSSGNSSREEPPDFMDQEAKDAPIIDDDAFDIVMNENINTQGGRHALPGVIPEGSASLAFVFDTTGSMYDDLVQVIEGAAKILATTLAMRDKPLYNYILVPFHDPEVGPVTVTTDPDKFQTDLRDLYVQGGGDCPEMSITGIKLALEVSLPYSFIYVFTDARAKDYDLTEKVLGIIQQKQSQVIFVMTGDCGDVTHPGFRAYEKIASTSSGQVFLLKKSQVREVLNFVRVAVQSRKVNLLSVDRQESDNLFFYELPVDSKLQEFTVSISGEHPKIDITDPSGNLLTHDNGLNTLLNLKNALIVNVKKPKPGLWGLKIAAEGESTVRVTGLSTLDFVHGFSKKGTLHLAETETRPIKGIPTHALVNVTDLDSKSRLTRLELINLNGDLIMELPTVYDPTKPSLYNVSSFLPPPDFFYLKIVGVDGQGYKFQRTTPTAISGIEPDVPEVSTKPVTRGFYEETALVTCEVSSLVPYEVQWLYNNEKIGNRLFYSEPANVSWSIPSVSSMAEGDYTCNVTNVAGSSSATTYLDIKDPPPIIIRSDNISALPGDDIELLCIARSLVDFNVTWIRHPEEVSVNQSHMTAFHNGTAFIRNLTKYDEGRYVCRASNEGGTTEEIVWLFLQSEPKVHPNIPSQNFVVGSNVSIGCKVSAHPVATFAWTKDGNIVEPTDRIKFHPLSGDLTIVNATREDAGDWSCIATNSHGTGSATIPLNLLEAPSIVVPQRTVLVGNGETAVLTCEPHGTPTPNVTWYRGGIELQDLSFIQILPEGTLKIVGTQDADAGEYECLATNEAGSHKETVELQVGTPAVMIHRPQSRGIDINKNITIPCSGIGTPQPRIRWVRPDGSQVTEDSPRVQILDTGSLFIHGIQKEDEGMYTCIVENAFSSQEASAFITVMGIVKPLIAYSSPNVDTILGRDVKLSCLVLTGNPTPKVTWTKLGEPITSNGSIVDDHNGKLLLKKVKIEDEGEYVCTASNAGGNVSHTIKLDVQIPPTIQDSPAEFTVTQGKSVKLLCEAAGDPKPTITWTKNGVRISEYDPHYFMDESGNLEIFNTDPSDSSMYSCTVINSAGIKEKRMSLFVQIPPTMSTEELEDVVVIVNSPVQLSCEVSGQPPPTVVWKKQGELIDFNDPSMEGIQFLSNNALRINRARVEDAGMYECLATSVAGTASRHVRLNVHVPPSFLQKSSGPINLTAVSGDEVILPCEVVGDPRPEVKWRKGQNYIDFYNLEHKYLMRETGSLIIPKVDVNDTATYRCIAENSVGIVTQEISLSVHEPPFFPDGILNSTSAIENQRVTLPCPARGTPLPRVRWFKEDAEVTGNEIGVNILNDGSLVLDHAQAMDAGQYACLAENVAGNVTRDISLRVYSPPKFAARLTEENSGGDDDEPEQSQVVENQPFRLLCMVDAIPPPQITWYKNGKELTDADMGARLKLHRDGRELEVKSATVEDTARYTCIARNLAGEIEKNFDMDVFVAPKIDAMDATDYNISAILDHPVIISCPVSGTPFPNIAWFKDNIPLSLEENKNVRVLSNGQKLEISSVSVEDAGRYKCVAKNEAGKDDREYELTVWVPASINGSDAVYSTEVLVNKSAILHCPASGYPTPEIVWYHNNEIVIPDNSSGIYIMDNGWQLHIPEAQVGHQGQYSCVAKNIAGESEKLYNVDVLSIPSIDRTALNVNPTVMLNGTTVFSCPAEGVPEPHISWLRNNEEIEIHLHPHMKLKSGGRQLEISSASVTDSATYRCVVVNKAGRDSQDFTLEVYVPANIDKTNLDQQPTVIVNHSRTLHCPVIGIPPPNIVWYKNGDVFSPDDNQYISIHEEGRRLEITSAALSDTGVYHCRVDNDAGEDELAYNLRVLYPPEINETASTISNPKVVVNDTAVIFCIVKGIPKPTIDWMFNSQLLDRTDQRFSLSRDGKRLEIYGAQVADTGRYTCLAKNEAGIAERDFDLEVMVPPYMDTTNLEVDVRVIKGKIVVFNCPVQGIPFPNITWFKGNDTLVLDPRMRILMAGRQLELSMTEESDAAKYTCQATNIAGHARMGFNLSVHVPPVIDEANVVDSPKIVVNRTIILECPVTGIPPPKVTWLKNGEVFLPRPGVKFLALGRQIEIVKTQVTDTARYTCVAVNEAGQLKKNYDLEVLVPPGIEGSGKTEIIEVVENHTAYLSCPTSGIPQPSMMWLKNGVPLADVPYSNMRELHSGHQLEVRSVRVADEGLYKCQANNVAGQKFKNFKLKVLLPPRIAGSRLEVEIPVNEKLPVRMECDATGVPEPKLYWSKDGVNITALNNSNHVRLLRGGRILQIPSSELSDSGFYKCTAQNVAGMDQKNYRLNVRVPPEISNSDTVEELSVVTGNSITLNCLVSGVPEPTIRWTREGSPLSHVLEPNIRIQEGGQKLIVSDAQLLDFGSYTCIANNVAGNATKEFNLKVYVAPTIEDGETEVASTVGVRTLLMCDTIGIPNPDVTWEKDGKVLPMPGPSYVMHRTGSLQFSSVQVENAGMYKCIARNDAGTAVRDISLTVQVPPKIDNQGPQFQKVIVGESVELPCNVSGIPRPRVMWQKGTRILARSAGYHIQPNNDSLKIESADIRDAGVYICIAQNNAGTSLNQVRLEVQVPPIIEPLQSEFSVIEEREVLLPCRVSGVPTPTVVWTKDNETISPDDVHYRILRSNWLAIPIVRAEDAGTFSCLAENEAGTASVSTKLTVHVLPTIEENERMMTVTEGETAELPCIANGSPPPKITWIQEGRTMLVSGGRYDILDSGTLAINKVQRSDTGSYVCTAKNVAGRASKEFLLRVQVPPTITVIPKDQEVNANGRIDLECAAEGVPTPIVTWKVNNSDYQTAPSIGGRSRLVIDNAMKRDDGTYMCIAENQAGLRRALAAIRVKVPPKVLIHSENQAVSMSEKVMLHCPVDGGDPPPVITWTKNDQAIELDSRVHQLQNGSLVIYDSSNADAGEYKCIATNDAGSSEGVAYLTVEMPPEFLVEPRDMTVEQGHLVMMDCVASGEPKPEMTWRREKVVLQNEDRISILPNNTLRIVASQLSDSGTYICIAKNGLGSILVYAKLNVQVSGHWSSWSSWSPCGVTCGQGLHHRTRHCDSPKPANGGRTCSGSNNETQTCSPQDCPVDGGWGDWSPWEQCSQTCGTGQTSRTRECNSPYPEHGGKYCVGETLESDRCNLQPCSVDGGWGAWSSWRHCSETCGKGVQERYRRCDSPRPDYGGRDCYGSDSERQACHLAHCEIHGNWGAWLDWSTCSLSCGGGTHSRRRRCDSPAPSSGGRFCSGSDSQTEHCNKDECPVHSEWMQWLEWGSCTVKCGGGQRRRFRTCGPTANNNGRPCIGPDQETEGCNSQKCAVDGEWDVWSAWSDCSRSCDGGVQSRSRKCKQPKFGGYKCLGDASETRKCNSNSCGGDGPNLVVANVVGNINNEEFGVSKITTNVTPTNLGNRISSSLRDLPPMTGGQLQHLISLLVSSDWAAASEINGAVNGYTLTRGYFRKEVHVEFATGEILKMTHLARGRDITDGSLQIDTIARGNIPALPDNTNIMLLPYHEDYIQTGPGSIYGYSSRVLAANGHMLPYAWNYSVVYNHTFGRMPYLVQRLSANDLSVNLDPARRALDYGVTASIAKGEPSNRCPAGFSLDPEGPYCQDDNECAQLNPCSHICQNKPGSFTCSCPPGMSLAPDGRTCKDIDECDLGIDDCLRSQECVNTIGSYRCLARCEVGHRRNSNTQACEDVDECSERSGLCEHECVNSRGGYFCTCKPGYRIIGNNRCEDINECQDRTHRCSQLCQNSLGSYQCSCIPGFRLVSDSNCVDIDECSERLHSCPAEQECVNDNGGYSCVSTCPLGYAKSADGSCADVDECLTRNNPCHYNQICSNMPGSYSCTCPRGFRTDGPSRPCVDVDECQAPSQCQHSCTNTVGSFTCSCPTGYRLTPNGRTCQDVDECYEMSINCGPNRRCFNRRGDFECVNAACPDEYQLDPSTGYCVIDCSRQPAAEDCRSTNFKNRQVLEFHMVALPSGIQAFQDIIRLLVYNHEHVHLTQTKFAILNDTYSNSADLPFNIRTEDGKGIVFTLRPLNDRRSYQMKVEGVAYGDGGRVTLYRTIFVIFISISPYPY